jgi:hypothetical protein
LETIGGAAGFAFRAVTEFIKDMINKGNMKKR